MTAKVLLDGGLPIETPHTFGCARSTGPTATKHGFIARASGSSIAQVFANSKRRGPFTAISEGKGRLAQER
jgi:hypothetical protein